MGNFGNYPHLKSPDIFAGAAIIPLLLEFLNWRRSLVKGFQGLCRIVDLTCRQRLSASIGELCKACL